MVTSHFSKRGLRFNVLVGGQLRYALQGTGVTQLVIAQAIGIERATLTRYLAGKKPIPMATYVDACEAIGVDPYLLIDQAYEQLIDELGLPHTAVSAGISNALLS